MMGHRSRIKKAWCLAGGVAALLAPSLALSGCSGGSDDIVSLGAILNGGQEVPVRATPAAGTATVRLNTSNNTIQVQMNTQGLNNVTAAHIHVGNPGENGPVIFDLYLPTDGPFPATLTRTLSAANFRPGSSPGGVTANTFDDAIDRIDEGRTYINVHTNNGVDPINEGPGDFPGGEIRGQIVGP